MAANAQRFALQRAGAVIRSGGVVLHATEGVWGLACDARCIEAVERILALKRRPVAKGLIVIGDCAERFGPELDAVNDEVRKAVLNSWPGAVTWVLPTARFGRHVTGGRDTVAVRVPDHAQARALCRLVGRPLVSTSANIAGQPAPRNSLQAHRAMGQEVDLVLAGETSGRRGPSQVRSWQGEIFRGA